MMLCIITQSLGIKIGYVKFYERPRELFYGFLKGIFFKKKNGCDMSLASSPNKLKSIEPPHHSYS